MNFTKLAFMGYFVKTSKNKHNAFLQINSDFLWMYDISSPLLLSCKNGLDSHFHAPQIWIAICDYLLTIIAKISPDSSV